MLTVGLAGALCTGKSFVLKIMAESGCFVAAADAIASKLMFSVGSRLYPELLSLFGAEIGNDNGEVDQNKLRQIIFSDAKKRKMIIDRVIPLEKEDREKLMRGAAESGIYPFFVYESAYLIESGIYHEFDRLVVTHTSREAHIERLMKRERISYHEADLFINRQIPLQRVLDVAHYTIDTSGTFEQTRNRTIDVFKRLQHESATI